MSALRWDRSSVRAEWGREAIDLAADAVGDAELDPWWLARPAGLAVGWVLLSWVQEGRREETRGQGYLEGTRLVVDGVPRGFAVELRPEAAARIARLAGSAP